MLNSKVIRNVQNRILQSIFSFACSNIWFLDLGAYTPGIKKSFALIINTKSLVLKYGYYILLKTESLDNTILEL